MLARPRARDAGQRARMGAEALVLWSERMRAGAIPYDRYIVRNDVMSHAETLSPSERPIQTAQGTEAE